MSARSRTAPCSREHGRPRAVLEVFSTNPPKQPPAQYLFLLSLPGRLVTCCLVSDRHADPGVRIITAARRPFFFYLAIHTGFSFKFCTSQNIRILGRLLSMTSQPPRGRGSGAKLHRSLCDRADTRIPSSLQPPCTCYYGLWRRNCLQLRVFFLVTARNFCMHQRSRPAKTTICQLLCADRQQLQLFQ